MTLTPLAVFRRGDRRVFALTYGPDVHWVKNVLAAGRCEIVTRNPVIDGDIWFADGPYRSMSDAKLARSTIGPCPNKQQDADN